jgi:hypothetical protein
MAVADRDALVRGFLRRQRKAGAKPPRITEDDPRWNPATMGNKRWGKGYRGALNYSKGRGRAD